MLGELEQALRHEEIRVLTLGREIKDLTSLLDRLEGEKREAEKQAMTSGHLLQQLESEFARVSERLQTSRQELQRLEAERTEKVIAARPAADQIAASEQQRARTGASGGRRPGATVRLARAPRSGGARCFAAPGPGRHARRTSSQRDGRARANRSHWSPK